MGTVEMRRHGDVLLLTRKGFKIPKSVKMNVTKLLHKGSNNSHVFKSGAVVSGEFEGKRVIRVKKPAVVSHVGGSATHKDGELPVGDYWVEIQTYYDHMAEEAKQVVD